MEAPEGYKFETVLVPTGEDRIIVIAGGCMTYYVPGHGPKCPHCGTMLGIDDVHGMRVDDLEDDDETFHPTTPPRTETPAS